MSWRGLLNKSILSRFLGLSALMGIIIGFYINVVGQNLSRVCLNADSDGSECNFISHVLRGQSVNNTVLTWVQSLKRVMYMI